MLETAYLIMSFLLLAYCIRMIVFLHYSYKHISKPGQTNNGQKSILSMSDKNNKRHQWVTFNDDTVIADKLTILETNYQSQDPKLRQYESESISAATDLAGTKLAKCAEYNLSSVVSIIVATRNEESIIDGLLNSLNMLTYDSNKFEVIVVDDSSDSTFRILEGWKKRMENLKIIKRNQKIGWKGGALNLALEYLRRDSEYVIILDADVIVAPHIIEEFLSTLLNCKNTCDAIQGYCAPYNCQLQSAKSYNWVSKGVEYRLAQRNMIEFVARNKLNLPVQITGNLFMIKTSTLRDIDFSNDLCEDWDLTLQLYLRKRDRPGQTETKNIPDLSRRTILFNEKLNAGIQVPTSFSSYFMQRLRVSEGHTRGFIKMIPRFVKNKQPIKNKIEVFLSGLHYLKNTIVLSLLLFDLYAVMVPDLKTFNALSITSFSIQLFCLCSFIITNVIGVVICSSTSKQYNFSFIISKLLLDICTLPATIIGSLLGILRKKGTFYKTRRIRIMQVSK